MFCFSFFLGIAANIFFTIIYFIIKNNLIFNHGSYPFKSFITTNKYFKINTNNNIKNFIEVIEQLNINQETKNLIFSKIANNKLNLKFINDVLNVYSKETKKLKNIQENEKINSFLNNFKENENLEKIEINEEDKDINKQEINKNTKSKFKI